MKRILLVDLDDPRRETRVRLLENAGHDVVVRSDHEASELLDHEAHFDLILLALHQQTLKKAAAYTDRIAGKQPHLPILLITDAGVYAPTGTVSRSMEGGDPAEMLAQIAEMLSGSTHIREIDVNEAAA